MCESISLSFFIVSTRRPADEKWKWSTHKFKCVYNCVCVCVWMGVYIVESFNIGIGLGLQSEECRVERAFDWQRAQAPVLSLASASLCLPTGQKRLRHTYVNCICIYVHIQTYVCVCTLFMHTYIGIFSSCFEKCVLYKRKRSSWTQHAQQQKTRISSLRLSLTRQRRRRARGGAGAGAWKDGGARWESGVPVSVETWPLSGFQGLVCICKYI